MTVTVRESVGARARLPAPESAWSTPTLTILDPSGASVAGGSVALDTASTTVASTPTLAYLLPLTSSAGFEVGNLYKITTDGIVTMFRCYRVDGNSIYADPAPSVMPESGDAVAGAEVEVTIPAIATRGHGYQLVVTEGDLEVRADMDVLRRRFLMDFRAVDLQRLLRENWPTAVLNDAAVDGLVTDVREEIRAEMIAAGAYPHEYVSPTAFRQLGFEVARRLLAKRHNLYPQDTDDRAAYLKQVAADESRYLARIISSWQPLDDDDDGAIDTPEITRFAGLKRR